jgi:hypothetical protein
MTRRRPLPKGSSGGETLPGSQDTPGALGLGLQASTGLTKTFVRRLSLSAITP